MTIYDRLVAAAEEGKRVKVDLKSKSLKIGKEMVIDGGKYEGELIGDLPRNAWEMADELFCNYYHSRPGRMSDKKRSYFAAKSSSEMNDVELACGEPRLVAQAKLEGFILCAVLAGYMNWNPRFGNWFWKSVRYPEFVLLKEWLTLSEKGVAA